MKVYFPNLNSIRFIAALLVIIHHIEQFRDVFGLPNYYQHPVQIIGRLGVILFFVLSGFLITYLLLVEEKETKQIDIKAFYIRRILRIWPLYYLILVLAFFIFPHINFFHVPGHEQTHWIMKIILFSIFLPNLVIAFGGGVAYASQAWSIGTEEQFYLIWPFLMKLVKNKLRLLLSILATYLAIKLALVHYSYNANFMTMLKIWDLFCIDCMAIGGLFAIVWFNKYENVILFLTHKATQLTVWVLTILLIANGINFGFLHFEIYSIMFGIIIFNLAVNTKSIVQFKNPIFDYLGKISYGLYMFHAIGIVVSIKIFMHFNIAENIFIYPCSILLTIILAHVSYNYFEKRFIKMKVKFSKVISGDNALNE